VLASGLAGGADAGFFAAGTDGAGFFAGGAAAAPLAVGCVTVEPPWSAPLSTVGGSRFSGSM